MLQCTVLGLNCLKTSEVKKRKLLKLTVQTRSLGFSELFRLLFQFRPFLVFPFPSVRKVDINNSGGENNKIIRGEFVPGKGFPPTDPIALDAFRLAHQRRTSTHLRASDYAISAPNFTGDLPFPPLPFLFSPYPCPINFPISKGKNKRRRRKEAGLLGVSFRKYQPAPISLISRMYLVELVTLRRAFRGRRRRRFIFRRNQGQRRRRRRRQGYLFPIF